MAVAKYKDPFADVDDGYENPFAEIDTPKQPPNPAKANADLSNGIMHYITPEDRKVIENSTTQEDRDFQEYFDYTNTKFGEKLPKDAVRQNLKFEYGENATAAYANEKNKSVIKHGAEFFSGIAKSFGKRTSAQTAILPQMIEDRTKLFGDIAKKIGLPESAGTFIEDAIIRQTPGALGQLQTASKNFVSLIPESAKKKMADFAFKQSKEAGEIQSKFMSGNSLKQSWDDGDSNAIVQDISTAIAFEFPQLAVQMGIGRLNPQAAMMYMSAGAAASKRADLGDDESSFRNVVQPMTSAMLEYGTEKYLGTGRIMDKAFKGEVVEGVWKNLGKLGLDFLGGAASEGGATAGENIVDIAFGDDKTVGEGVALSAIVGGFMDTSVSLSLTLGDMNRLAKTKTEPELVEMEEAGELTPEQAQVVRAPDAEREQALNDMYAEEERLAEEAMETKRKVDEQKPEIAGKAIETESKEEKKPVTTPKGKPVKVVKPEVLDDAGKPVYEIVTTKNAKDGDTIGVSRKQSNILKEARNQVLSVAPETEKHFDVIEAAAKDYDSAKITMRVNEILSVKGTGAIPITAKEVGQGLIRKTELAVDSAKLIAKRDQAEKDGDKDLFDDLDAEVERNYIEDIRLQKAIETSVTENARGMAMAGRIMDKKSYKLVDIMRNATSAKHDFLTKPERASLENLAKELKATQDQSAKEAKSLTESEELLLKEMADDAVGEMLSTMKIRRTKEEIKAKHAKLRKKLPSLAARMNDITGVTAETAKAITELAMNYIHDGATSLKELTTIFMEQTDGFTEQDFYQAISGRTEKAATKAKSEAQIIMTEAKARAALHDQIINAVDGMFDPLNPVKKSSAEIKDLRNKLKLLKASVVRVERDDQRVDSIFDTIDNIEKMIDLKYRPIKIVNKKSKDLIEAEKLLKVPKAELAAQDQIALLEEVLRTDGVIKKAQGERGETSQRLEEFRAKIVILKELIVKKNAPKKKQEAYKLREKALDAKIAELTTEVEQFIRTISPKKETRVEMVARNATKSELLQAKRDQDALAELFDIIRNKRVPDTKKTESKKDPHGYKEMIQNVRNQMQSSEWFSEWKQTRDESNKLSKSEDAIADMERRIKSGDFEGFVTTKQVIAIKNEKLISSKIKEQRLKREVNERIRALKPMTKMDLAKEILNIPRSAKLTFDMGHIWRQAGIVLSGPNVSIREATKVSIDTFLSQEKSDAIDLWTISHPDYEKAKIAGVKLNDAGENLSEGRERLLHSDLLEQVPYYGEIVKMSARSQLVALNFIRLTWFSNYVKNNPDQSPEQLKQAAKALNVMTGYADLTPHIGQVAPALDGLMTSFRFSWSRAEVHALLPYAIAKKNKALAIQLSKDLAAFYTTRAGLMMTAAYLFPQLFAIGGFFDDDEYKDGLNGKLIMKVGNGYVRIYDPWAGIAQATSAIGGVLTGDENAMTGLADYLGTKGSPQVQLFRAAVYGKDWRGKEIIEDHPIASRAAGLAMGMVPITLEGIKDSMMKETGAVDLIASTVTDFVGVGSYLMKEEDAKK